MTDQEILDKLGLSPNDLRDFFEKFNRFVDSLNHDQRTVFLRALKSSHEEAAELGQDVTPERLEGILRQFAPPGAILCIVCALHRHPRESE